MRIGELADRVGTNPKTIRYYEGIGLLPDAERLPSGYRDYTDADVDRLRFVKTAQRLGLALSEISEVLSFRRRAEMPCDYVRGVLDRQVAELDRRMAEMTDLRRQLISLRNRTGRLGSVPSRYCAVIERGQAMDSATPEGQANPRPPRTGAGRG
jgi:DNA-binding transcriptional MerR regulator